MNKALDDAMKRTLRTGDMKIDVENLLNMVVDNHFEPRFGRSRSLREESPTKEEFGLELPKMSKMFLSTPASNRIHAKSQLPSLGKPLPPIVI